MRILRAALAASVCLFSWAGMAQTPYREPPDALKAIVDAPRTPLVSLSPHRDLIAFTGVPGLPGIDVVAQPELKLAGIRIHPGAFARSSFTFGNDFWLMDVASGAEFRVEGLPKPLSLAGSAWSPDQKYLVLNQVEPATGTNALWLVDIGTRRARLLVEGLNAVAGRSYRWMPDSRALLVNLRPDGLGPLPSVDVVPTGPNVQQTGNEGRVTSIRTYQDLLKNEAEARQFEYLLRSQPALVGIDGKIARVGAPDLYVSLEPSPDGKHVLGQRIARPFSYLVPYSSFPRTIEVLDLGGRSEHTVARLPLVEGLPTGNDAVRTGVRDIDWRSDAPATLVWAEAQDGGDPARDAAVRDIVYQQAAPFATAPVALAKLGSRYAGTDWARGDLALVGEYWWKTRRFKTWRVQPDAPQTPATLFDEGSSEDRYADRGNPVSTRDARGQVVLLLSADGTSLYRIGDGASPEGDRPFLDRQDLATGETRRLFHSSGEQYERPVAMLDAEGKRVVTSRESPRERPNYYLRTLEGDAAPVALTRFPHPTPQLRDISKELIRYKRADGVELTGTLYLPPGYDARRDGALPMLMWAYPAEFKSAAAASQVTDSPYRFNAVSYWGPMPFLAMGYAVLDDPSMPIIGEGKAEPNDTYVQQLAADAQAAVDEVVRRGVADRNRIAVGGHSYGAFMTANLLAHTRLFKAGIARSGAYNRTLTPFGFQSEERNFWQAPETYAAMSPFNHAGSIKDALLMIHGEQDNNSGTFPMQSERMFAAVKGLGGNARLVMLPNESHGYRARESIMTMLAEMNDWLEQYVKGAKADAAAP